MKKFAAYILFIIISISSFSQTNSNFALIKNDTVFLTIPECMFEIKSMKVISSEKPNIFIVKLTIKSNQTLNLEIRDKDKKNIFSNHFENLILFTEFEIDMTNVGEGNYYLIVNNGDKIMEDKLVKE